MFKQFFFILSKFCLIYPSSVLCRSLTVMTSMLNWAQKPTGSQYNDFNIAVILSLIKLCYCFFIFQSVFVLGQTNEITEVILSTFSFNTSCLVLT